MCSSPFPPRNVCPFLLFFFAELAVFRPPRNVLLGIQLAEDIFDFSRVICSQVGGLWISRLRGQIKTVTIDWLLPGLALSFQPIPRGKRNETIPGEILGRS